MHKIKSFVSRNGRVTRAQKDALTCLIGDYGIIYSERILNLDETFGRGNPKILEVGFVMVIVYFPWQNQIPKSITWGSKFMKLALEIF